MVIGQPARSGTATNASPARTIAVREAGLADLVETTAAHQAKIVKGDVTTTRPVRTALRSVTSPRKNCGCGSPARRAAALAGWILHNYPAK